MKATLFFRKGYLLFGFLMSCSFQSYSQQSAPSSNETDGLWQLIDRVDACELYCKKSVCDLRQDGISKEEIYFQLKNVSGDTIQVSYDLVLFYGARCYNCDFDNDELKLSITLMPYQSIEGACGDNNVKRLKVFSKFLSGESEVKLSDYQVKNLKITII